MRLSKRNVGILVACLVFVTTLVPLLWFAYQNLLEDSSPFDEDTYWVEPAWPGVGSVVIAGHVSHQVNLTTSAFASQFTAGFLQLDRDFPRVDRAFNFKNDFGTEWTERYGGVSLRVLVETLHLNLTPHFTVEFVAQDGYKNPHELNETVIWAHPDEIIVADTYRGRAMDPKLEGGDGPFRSVVERGLVANPNSQDLLKWLSKVLIVSDETELAALPAANATTSPA